MVIDATKKKAADTTTKEFEMAGKAGIKPEMVKALNSIITQYKGELPKHFGPEEVFYMLDQGLVASGVKENFEVRSLMYLARAFLHGYALGLIFKGK